MPSYTNTLLTILLGVLLGITDGRYCLKSALDVLLCFSANQVAKSCYSTTDASDFYLTGEGGPGFASWCLKNF